MWQISIATATQITHSSTPLRAKRRSGICPGSRLSEAPSARPSHGWTLVATGDFNGDSKPDYVLYNASTQQTAIWYMNNNVYAGGAYGPTLPAGWSLAGVADFNPMENSITYSSIRARVNPRSGICLGPPMSAARMGQPSPALGDWWGSAILTGTASPITSFTMRARSKQRSGT